MHHPTDRITHTTAFVTPVVEHWLERELHDWCNKGCGMCYPACGIVNIKYPLERVDHIGPYGAVVMSSANGLEGTGFASRYWLQPRAGF